MGEGGLGEIQVMNGCQHSATLIFPRLQTADQIVMSFHIQPGEWFIEKKDVRALSKCTCEKHTLLLTP